MSQQAPPLAGTVAAADILGWSLRKTKREAKAGRLPYVQKMPGRTGAYLFDRNVIETIAANRARAEAAVA